jgi:hypothetical protein
MNESATPHTIESLAELPRKTDVIAIAESMGLDTEGTRAEISRRIVDGLDAHSDIAIPTQPTAASDLSVVVIPSAVTDADLAAVTSVTVEHLRSEVPELPEVPAAPVLRLSTPARASLFRSIGSLMGTEEAKAEIEGVIHAIESGKQVCIVAGKGNRRYDVQVFDVPFDAADCSTDIPPGRDGVSVNLTRRLAVQVLYPRG